MSRQKSEVKARKASAPKARSLSQRTIAMDRVEMRSKPIKAAEPIEELVDIEEELRTEDAKFKITIYLDGDVLVKLRKSAEEDGSKYQPFLNKLLRRVLLEEKTDLEKRLEAVERFIADQAK